MLQAELARLWEEHTNQEFLTRDTESTLATMVEDAYVNHVPVPDGWHGQTPFLFAGLHSGHATRYETYADLAHGGNRAACR
jgi:hypothetical protein